LETPFPVGDLSPLLDSIPTMTIQGRPTSKRAGVKSKFFGLDDKLCSVEELVIQHFSVNMNDTVEMNQPASSSSSTPSSSSASSFSSSSPWKGIHTENGLWMTLVSMFFADIMFANTQFDDEVGGKEVPIHDAFHTKFQCMYD
jgi:hypothetical protein